MTETSPITAVLEPSMTTEMKEQYKDLIVFATEIDFTPLFQAVSKKLGLVNTLEFSTPRIYERQGGFHIDYESVNIVEHVGVLASVLDEVHIRFVSDRIIKDEERNGYFFWASVTFSYRHMTSSPNGLGLATVFFDNEKGWTIKFVEPLNRD